MRRLKDHPREECSSEEVRQSLEIIRDEAFRCKQITRGLLDLSRKGDENQTPTSIWPVVETAVTLAKASDNDPAPTINVNGDRSDSLSVRGSSDELKQVLLNLISNAIDAAKPNACRVDVNARRRDGCVELQVRDNGRGMTRETIAQVFEPFFTLNKGRGVGLGLAISLAIVERHRGTLEAGSEGPGRGSVFTLRLPAEAEVEV
jgi:signal transduction histidine kinase